MVEAALKVVEGDIPSAAELVERARKLIPVLRERAAAGDAAANVVPETIEDMKKAGLFRVLQPKRWGGYEMSPKTFYDVQMALAEGDMSVGWIYGVIGVHNWQIALFDDRAAREVFENNPDAIIASTYMPKGKTEAVEGGYRFSGRWQFSSGSKHAQWFFLGGLFPGAGEGVPNMGTFLIPLEDVEIVETWDTHGLKATGSHDVIVKDAFVPDYRTHTHRQGFEIDSPGNAVNTGPLYRLPFGQVFLRSVSTASIGALQALLNEVIAFGSGKLGSFGGRTSENPFAQLAVAEAAATIADLKNTLYANFDHMERHAAAGTVPAMEDRLRFKYQSSEVASRCAGVAAKLFRVAGGSGLFLEKPFARILANIESGGQHQANSYELWGANFGASLFGAENQDIFL
ncbi:acyl-CoA dehydrogenase family protein [Rhizorhabdus dicambivorans]|uniref:Flavin-dependent monooxygenase n=1 Tax=Rhizorhabdus dicambivorans TaxID=1850238 RepID=A0A2A4FZ27_9SPHN|nr:acyl-CoA dehydrogenase family protein [Rhizorhabdus dicambivorans]ATE65854.1 flavin-dependent monooxygenase [Rhizorhabdus dicambivorans]PCE42968.1 flavin-dependent monooxygenase [Rhizorhabdus dicambivorans]